jgi:hypothetical protein
MMSTTAIRGTIWPSKEAADAGRPFEMLWPAWKDRVRNPRHTARTPDEKLALQLYAPARFQDGHRKAEAVEEVTAIALDIDSTPTDTGWVRGEPDLDPESLRQFLDDLLDGGAWVAHVTPTSRPGAWRWRVIVAIARAVTVEEHHECCTALRLRALSLESFALEADAASWDSAARGYFVPARGASEYIALDGGEDEPLDVDALLDEVRSLPTDDGLTVEKRIFKARDELVASRTTGRRVRLVRASDVTPQRTRWLWERLLPAGKLALLTGEPGLGKSSITVDLAARISRGELPGDWHGSPRAVLVCSFEDDPIDVIRPRLDAAGADTAKVHFVEVDDEDGTPGLLRFPEDIARLRSRIERVNAALLVIDPIVCTFSGDIDSHKDAHVRRAFGPLSKLAQETGCAVLCVSHTNKSNATDIHRRQSGSIAFTGAARNVFLAAPDPEDPEKGRVFVHAKSNTGALAPARRFAMAGVDVGNGIGAVRVVWGEDAPNLNVATVLGPPLDSETKSALDDAKDFLRKELAEGAKAATAVSAAAAEQGITDATLRRARVAICQTSKRSDGWWWGLRS